MVAAPAAPVAVAKVDGYYVDLAAQADLMFAQIGGFGNSDCSKIDLRASPSRMPSSIARPPGRAEKGSKWHRPSGLSSIAVPCILPFMKPIHWVLLGACLLLRLEAQPRPQRQFELKAESGNFWKLIDRGATLEKVASGFGFLEGPAWHPEGFLYVTDETNNRVSRVFPDGRIEKVLDVGDPDGSTMDRNYRLITTGDTKRVVIAVQPDGTYRVLADKYEGKRLNSPNDIVLGPDGAFYFTDPNLDLPKDQKQEIPFQGVYRLGTDGSLRLLVKDLSAPNGLAFSPDGKRLYIDDSKTREIRVYDVGRNGDLSSPRLFGKEEGPRGSGVPDGMRVDRRGNLFVTGPLGIWVWAPSGRHLGTIVLPENAANLAWGDADLRTLYITATSSVYRLKTRTRGFVPYMH